MRRRKLLAIACVPLAAGLAPSCGQDETRNARGSGDSDGSASGFAGAPGEAGGGPRCGSMTCQAVPPELSDFAEVCCMDDACGYRAPSLSSECFSPQRLPAVQDLDCPALEASSVTLPGCCLDDGVTCGVLEEALGLGCLDRALLGVPVAIDCDGRSLGDAGADGGAGADGSAGSGGAGGASGAASGGAGGAGGSAGAAGAGVGGTGGTVMTDASVDAGNADAGGGGSSASGGSGGTAGSCATCDLVLHGFAQPSNLCPGAATARWSDLTTCACSSTCATACASMCVDPPTSPMGGCIECIFAPCGVERAACVAS